MKRNSKDKNVKQKRKKSDSSKLVRTDDDINDAVQEWLHYKKNAIKIYGHIRDWDTTNVTNMFNLFNNATDFDEDISNWDVHNVTTMGQMFLGAGISTKILVDGMFQK